MKKSTAWWSGVVALVVVVGAYAVVHGRGEGAKSAAAAASAAGGQPVSVSSVRAVQGNVNVTLEATGAVSALNSVEVHPQVSSTITKVHIREGQFVKAGDLMFSLDSRTDEVNVTKARAQLVKDQATYDDAQRQLARSRELFAQNFIAQGAVDTTQAQAESAAAVVASDRAAIEAAQVSLGYNRIVAATAGRAGAINVFAGSSVQPGGAPLVTLTQIDPIAVSFNLPQRNLPDALQRLRTGGGSVSAVMPEGRGSLTGKLQFVDNNVDAGSGTVKVKAVFDNREQKLWPGAYVTVRMVTRTLKAAITIPQAAIIQGPQGNVVYLVGDDKKAVLRPVQVVDAVGDNAVVTGVRAGERVVIDGRQNLRPGSALAVRDAASAPRRSSAAASDAASMATAASAP